MNNYLLDVDKNSLQNLLFDFYTLTNIRIAVFDTEHNLIIAYPETECSVCAKLKSVAKTCSLCLESDRKSFEKCAKEKKLCLYHCHAGLIEATTPLVNDNGLVIGYVMFGQITDERNKKKVITDLRKYLSSFNIEASDEELYVKHKEPEQIKAAAKILETCTLYLLSQKYIRVSKKEFISQIDSYIDQNLNNDLSIDKLADVFDYSRTNLYSTWNLYMNISLGEYIKNKRIEKAKWYLQYSKEKIETISYLVGFNDYNYFCRVFKKEVGIPAKKYRKQSKN